MIINQRGPVFFETQCILYAYRLLQIFTS